MRRGFVIWVAFAMVPIVLSAPTVLADPICVDRSFASSPRQMPRHWMQALCPLTSMRMATFAAERLLTPMER